MSKNDGENSNSKVKVLIIGAGKFYAFSVIYIRDSVVNIYSYILSIFSNDKVWQVYPLHIIYAKMDTKISKFLRQEIE